MFGGIVGVIGFYYVSFFVFLFVSFLMGVYMSVYGFYWFVVVDMVFEVFCLKVIFYVMVGGLVVVIIGF